MPGAHAGLFPLGPDGAQAVMGTPPCLVLVMVVDVGLEGWMWREAGRERWDRGGDKTLGNKSAQPPPEFQGPWDPIHSSL